MPNPGADQPLRKVTLNLYEADCAHAESYFGHGWTTQLREEFHRYMSTTVQWHKLRKTLGDME